MNKCPAGRFLLMGISILMLGIMFLAVYIITHKKYLFHKQQIPPSVSKCMNGKCNERLCHPIDEQFVAAADAYYYIPGDKQKDPMIGKMVKKIAK
jgi:hypothetical protein